MTPSHIWPRALEESAVDLNKNSEPTGDVRISGSDPSSPPIGSENQGPVYRGQPLRRHSRRNSPFIRSLSKGLKGHPLTTITKMLPVDHTRGEGRLTLEMFVD